MFSDKEEEVKATNPYLFSYNDDWTEAFGDEGEIESWLLAELSTAFFVKK